MTKSKTKTSRPTVQDVANLAGVSASTVSLVLQGKGSLPEDTRAKVKKAVEQAGYTPLRVRRGKSDYPVVAVIADDAENPYYAELCLAIEDALENRNCLLVLASSRGSEERQVQLLKTFAEMGCLGVFLIPANGSDQPTLNAIRNSTIPIVLGVRHLGFGSIDYVGPNYFLGMQLATRHLLDLGHKNIALVGGFPENTAYAERLGGFRMSISSDGDPAIQTTEMVGPATAEFGMAAIELGRDAGGTQHRVVLRVTGDDGDGRLVGRIRHEGLHGLAHRRLFERGRLREEGARHVVELNGKLVASDFRERIGERRDRVVVTRHRGVTTLVGHAQREIGRDLLGRLHAVEERLAVA